MIFFAFCVTAFNLIVHKSKDGFQMSMKGDNKIVKALLCPKIQVFFETVGLCTHVNTS